MNFCDALKLLKEGHLLTRSCYINREDSDDYYFCYIGLEIAPFPSIRAQSFDGKEIVSDGKATFNSFDILAEDWIKYENKKLIGGNRKFEFEAEIIEKPLYKDERSIISKTLGHFGSPLGFIGSMNSENLAEGLKITKWKVNMEEITE